MAYISRAPPSHLNMEMSFPFHGSNCKNDAMVERMEAVMRSLSFSDEMKPSLKFLIESSVSFNGRGIDPFQLETSISRKTSTSRPDTSSQPKSLGFSPLKRSFESTTVGVDSPKHHAALKLQKVYKSFRTRRQLADCAVLVEQRWWKLLDFAMLKLSSVSFFDIERTESAISRWSRARTRAAKVGKGLSKNEKAQKLALQHWLEAIDPRHRYGHNLHFYYDCWLQCESMEPFFYWLDVGQGKEVNLEEQCSRSKLQEQCIKYLGPKEREAYEVVIEDGKFMYKQSRQPLDTTGDPTDSKWIFVLSTSRNLYIAQKKKGKFQHSSFLAGGATSAAGQLVIENGVLKAVWPHSGHYRPTEDNFQEFMNFLMENNVDLADVKKSSKGEEDVQLCNGLRHCPSEADLAERGMPQTKADLSYNFNGETCCRKASTKDTPFEVESNACSLAHLKLEGKEKATASIEASKSSIQRYVFRKNNLLTEEQGVNKQPFVPSELILRRINSKKGIESYQLGKQLSFKWTTGAGPRIGCVRDYPSELQFQALEEVSLSPTIAGMSRFASPRTARCQNPAPLQTSMEQQQQRQQPQKPDCKDRRRNLSL